MNINKLRNRTVLLTPKPIKIFVSQSKGFTLIETLVGFSIFSIIIALVPICIVVLFQFKSLLIHDRTYTLEMMIREIAQTVHSVDHKIISVNQSKLTIPHKVETISYSFENSKIIKSVNNKGNITMFNDVRHLNFYREGRHIIMRVKYIEGHGTRTHEVIL
ncbi:prepilin-type N-terminal cleavage/methylation domain-containing protein [Staphylococcus agnetis]|uniref:competence type IV pilus minor pilin ComGF n=1 Tax=Staphylococcus agnetis TaxID=985762 RepID=UPI0021D290B2|nr:competence type IV pilus minor pilin ComGF [Staphylococcus agnetis]UXU53915.1 prepilin-type N-terminal cleavage/methylation domain-containing protein [Staphylococcus agnetis]